MLTAIVTDRDRETAASTCPIGSSSGHGKCHVCSEIANAIANERNNTLIACEKIARELANVGEIIARLRAAAIADAIVSLASRAQ